MKKLITICLLIATTLTANAQYKSAFNSMKDIVPLMGMSRKNIKSILNDNVFIVSNFEEINEIDLTTYKPEKLGELHQTLTVGLKEKKVALISITMGTLSSYLGDTTFDKNFAKNIKKYKSSLKKAGFKLIKEKEENGTDGVQFGQYENITTKQKAEISNTNTYMELVIYSEEIDISKLKQ